MIAAFVAELRRRDPLLFWAAVANLMLLVLMLLAAPFDGREVTGLNPWIKPMKFALSIAIYLLTVAWLMGDLRLGPRARRAVSLGVTLTMVTEIVLIAMQAARGTRSHFNNSSPFDAAVFSVMGFAILANSLLALYLTARAWATRPPLPPAYLWGVRLGLAIFLLASLEGMVMVLALAHSVGTPDGGPGLPFVNWSTAGGDLRVAHFVGMHALQLLPLAGHLVARAGRPARWVVLAGLGYGALALALFVQALAGKPLIGL